MVLALALASYSLGNVVFLEPFHVIPVTLASWYGSKKTGILLALNSAVLLTALKAPSVQYEWIIWVSYGLPMAIGLSTLAILVTNFRGVHQVESEAADTDYLTGLKNARGFYGKMANELLRASRYEHRFSLVYLDIDNFKAINDSLGHAEGDRLLVAVANCLARSLRATDTIARLGGDEFACLLPETEPDEAKTAVLKCRTALDDYMNLRAWPVSFSVGLVTFAAVPNSINEAMRVADELMYTVKHGKKNDIAFEVWRGKSRQSA